jgi:hypothetical protein
LEAPVPLIAGKLRAGSPWPKRHAGMPARPTGPRYSVGGEPSAWCDDSDRQIADVVGQQESAGSASSQSRKEAAARRKGLCLPRSACRDNADFTLPAMSGHRWRAGLELVS